MRVARGRGTGGLRNLNCRNARPNDLWNYWILREAVRGASHPRLTASCRRTGIVSRHGDGAHDFRLIIAEGLIANVQIRRRRSSHRIIGRWRHVRDSNRLNGKLRRRICRPDCRPRQGVIWIGLLRHRPRRGNRQNQTEQEAVRQGLSQTEPGGQEAARGKAEGQRLAQVRTGCVKSSFRHPFPPYKSPDALRGYPRVFPRLPWLR